LDFQIDEVIQFMSKFAYMLTNVDWHRNIQG
jgi:hypothetical protein